MSKPTPNFGPAGLTCRLAHSSSLAYSSYSSLQPRISHIALICLFQPLSCHRRHVGLFDCKKEAKGAKCFKLLRMAVAVAATRMMAARWAVCCTRGKLCSIRPSMFMLGRRGYADRVVKVPSMAESITEGTLKQWSKRNKGVSIGGGEN